MAVARLLAAAGACYAGGSGGGLEPATAANAAGAAGTLTLVGGEDSSVPVQWRHDAAAESAPVDDDSVCCRLSGICEGPAVLARCREQRWEQRREQRRWQEQQEGDETAGGGGGGSSSSSSTPGGATAGLGGSSGEEAPDPDPRADRDAELACISDAVERAERVREAARWAWQGYRWVGLQGGCRWVQRWVQGGSALGVAGVQVGGGAGRVHVGECAQVGPQVDAG